MHQIGITGGIGSGKSIVSQVFKTLGIPVLDADAVAKLVMEQHIPLVNAIKNLLGNQAYINGRLNRPFIASEIFEDTDKLTQLNTLVHPVTIQYARDWVSEQKAPYIIKEAAILFESGSYVEMNKIIGVYAPEQLRLERAMKRNNVTATEIEKRMDKQMNEEEKMSMCDYVIDNSETTSVIAQVISIHHELLLLSASG